MGKKVEIEMELPVTPSDPKDCQLGPGAQRPSSPLGGSLRSQPRREEVWGDPNGEAGTAAPSFPMAEKRGVKAMGKSNCPDL